MGLWARQGKPDFAQCAAIVSRFDPTLRESLNRSENKVLQWFIHYIWSSSAKTGKDQTYISFSQVQLGQKFGRSRWTVKRAVDKLAEYGLIKGQFRRPKAGCRWQTCLYHLGPRLKAILARILGQPREKTPCSTFAPQEFRKKTLTAGAPPAGCAASQERTTRDGNDGPSPHLRAIFERLGLGDGGYPIASANHAGA